MELISCEKVYHQREKTVRGKMTNNATSVGCAPEGGEWSKSYKASGYERSSQKTHNFAKNVT